MGEVFEGGELTYGFRSPGDLFEKVKRDVAKLDDVTLDHIYNFMVAAWQLQEWLDPNHVHSGSSEARKDLKNNYLLQACRNICDVSKHFAITRHREKRVPTRVNVIGHGAVLGMPAAILGRMQLGTGPWDEIRITARYDNHVIFSYDVRYLAHEVVALYEAFFTTHEL